jgi:predicted dehydrogenase
MVNVAVVGCGYWGPNLIRNFSTCPQTHLVAACDQDPDRLKQVLCQYPTVKGYSEFEQMLAHPGLDAVAIATPVRSHAPLAMAALRAGKNVLVEKPMAASIREAEALAEAADAAGLVLMVDHVYVHSGPVQKMKQIIDSGALGDVYFIDSVRINLGLFQHDVNVVWDLAPHDLSIVDYLLGRLPKSLAAFGSCHADLNNEIEDVAYLNLDFGGGLLASFHISWLSPVKIRHFIVGGDRQSIIYNDLDPSEKIKIYDRGIAVSRSAEAVRGLLIGYRTGDVHSPNVDRSEPVQSVVRDFAASIEEGRRPLTDAQAGVRVVRILEAAQRSIKAQGGRITL